MTGVANPGLKARLAVAWTNDRRQAGAAQLAVEAYCETVEGLLEGRFDEPVPGFGTSTLEKVALAKRALQIGRNTLKGNALPDRATAVAKAIYERARDSREHAVFIDADKLMAEYGLVDEGDIGRDAEAVASAPFDLAALWSSKGSGN